MATALMTAAAPPPPVAPDYTVRVPGKEIAVQSVPTRYNTPASFGTCDLEGPVKIEVTVNFLAADKPVRDVVIENLRYGKDLIRAAAAMGLRTNAQVQNLLFSDK
jgi:hypothetical protein